MKSKMKRVGGLNTHTHTHNLYKLQERRVLSFRETLSNSGKKRGGCLLAFTGGRL